MSAGHPLRLRRLRISGLTCGFSAGHVRILALNWAFKTTRSEPMSATRILVNPQVSSNVRNPRNPRRVLGWVYHREVTGGEAVIALPSTCLECEATISRSDEVGAAENGVVACRRCWDGLVKTKRTEMRTKVLVDDPDVSEAERAAAVRALEDAEVELYGARLWISAWGPNTPQRMRATVALRLAAMEAGRAEERAKGVPGAA